MRERPHRESPRLKGYDSGQPGTYFVTICTAGQECLFGQVVDGEMCLSAFGQIAHEEWLQISHRRPTVARDAFVVMPNHLHGIVIITGGTQQAVSGRFGEPPTSYAKVVHPSAPGLLAGIVRSYKSGVTRRINEARGTSGLAVWQGRFYDHIIRDEQDLARMREYIARNPARWEEDRYYAEEG